MTDKQAHQAALIIYAALIICTILFFSMGLVLGWNGALKRVYLLDMNGACTAPISKIGSACRLWESHQQMRKEIKDMGITLDD